MVKVVVVICKYKEGEVMATEEVIYSSNAVVVVGKEEEVETYSSIEAEETEMGVVGTYNSKKKVVMEKVVVVICSDKVDTHAGKKVVEAEMHKGKACKAGSLQLHYWPSSKMPRPKLDEAKIWSYFLQLSNRIQSLPLNLIPL